MSGAKSKERGRVKEALSWSTKDGGVGFVELTDGSHHWYLSSDGAKYYRTSVKELSKVYSPSKQKAAIAAYEKQQEQLGLRMHNYVKRPSNNRKASKSPSKKKRKAAKSPSKKRKAAKSPSKKRKAAKSPSKKRKASKSPRKKPKSTLGQLQKMGHLVYVSKTSALLRKSNRNYFYKHRLGYWTREPAASISPAFRKAALKEYRLQYGA